jgi:formate dehydrogenase beta subunit
MMRTQIPRFRLPESVIDEETGYILDLGVEFRGGQYVESLKDLLAEGYDAVFVGSGAPRGRDLDIPGRKKARETSTSASTGWPVSLRPHDLDRQARDRARRRQHRDGLLPLGAPLGGEDVKVIVRSGFEQMKASPWEKEDAMHEGIPILNNLVPKAFTTTAAAHRRDLREGAAVRRRQGRRSLVPTGEPDVHFECDEVLVAVGQENAFPWIERDIGIEFDKWGLPVLDERRRMQSTVPNVFFGGDAAFGPKNIIWAVAHGHEAAVSIDRLNGEDHRRAPGAA